MDARDPLKPPLNVLFESLSLLSLHHLDSFLKSNLGGPTPAEFDALTEEKNTLAAELEKVKGELAAAQAKIEELSAASAAAPAEEAPAE